MRFVVAKTTTQQAGAMVFRTRDLFVRQRAQLINALRGHLAEHGVIAPQGVLNVKALADIVEDEASSRPVIREALRSLAAIGAVDIQRGYGTVVREPDFHALSEYFSFVLAQQADVVDDLVEVRIAIEKQGDTIGLPEGAGRRSAQDGGRLPDDCRDRQRPSVRWCRRLQLPFVDSRSGPFTDAAERLCGDR